MSQPKIKKEGRCDSHPPKKKPNPDTYMPITCHLNHNFFLSCFFLPVLPFSVLSLSCSRQDLQLQHMGSSSLTMD